MTKAQKKKYLRENKIGFGSNTILIVANKLEDSWNHNLTKFKKDNLKRISKRDREIEHKNGTIYKSITYDMIPNGIKGLRYCQYISLD